MERSWCMELASTTRPACGSATCTAARSAGSSCPIQRDEQESRYTRDLIPGYAFTPDGKSVLAAYGGKIHRLDVQTGADQVIPFTARVSQPVGSRLNFPVRVDDGPVKARLIQGPEPSPDGKHLAFSALTKLYVMDLPDGKPRQLSAGRCARVSTELVARRQVPGLRELVARGRPHLEAARRRPGPARAAHARGAFYSDPVWTPDGKRIVALRAPRQTRVESPYGSGAVLDLVWVPAEGGDATVISPARGASGPHFAREADRIYLTTPQGLVSMRFDGTDRRTHLAVTGKTAYSPSEPEPADQIVLSPDGRWALARVTNQLYLLALPQFGGEAPKVSVHEPSVPLKKLTDIGADYAAWADGGKTITWAIGASFFRLPFDSVVFPPLKSEDEDKGEDKEKAEAEKKAQKPKPEEAGGRDRAAEAPAARDGRPQRGQGDHDARRRGHHRGRHRRDRPPDRGRRAQGIAQGPRRSQGHRRDGQYDRTGLHRHAPALDGDSPRSARHAELELLRQPRLWRDRPAATRRPARTTCSPIKTWSRPASWSGRAPFRPGRASSPTTISSRPKTSKPSSPDTRSITARTP